MKRLVTHRFLPLFSLLLIFVAVMHAGVSETSAFIIMDNTTGGDCAYFGNWNAKTKTCTLTADLEEAVEISSNGVTLAGNGYAIRGTPTEGSYILGGGVTLDGVMGVSVTHLTVENFEVGLYLYGVTEAAVTHNSLLNNFFGILLESSNQNEVIANYLSLSWDGIFLYRSKDNTITGNSDEGSKGFAIYLYESDSNNIIGNAASLSEMSGIWILASDFNKIAGNSIDTAGHFGLFMDWYSESNTAINNNVVNSTPAADYSQVSDYGIGNTVEGNYWSNYDSEIEGCEDVIGGSDGVCDDGYVFDGGEDAFARVTDTVASATVEISPNVIKTKTQEKKTIVAYIEVPGFAAEEATVESVRIVTDKGFVWANETSSQMGDYDGDGVPELMVKFNKELVKKILNPGLNEGAVVGSLAENTFEGVVFITLE